MKTLMWRVVLKTAGYALFGWGIVVCIMSVPEGAIAVSHMVELILGAFLIGLSELFRGEVSK